MKSILKRVLRWSVYWFVLPLVVFYLAVWILNPQDRALDHFNTRLEAESGIRVDYGQARISPLGSLTLTDLIVHQVTDHKHTVDGQEFILPKRRYFSGERLDISLHWRSFVKGRAALKLEGSAYNSDFNGLLDAPIQMQAEPFNVTLDWENLDLQQLAKDYPDIQVRVGKCQGNARFLVDLSKTFKFKGPLTFEIKEAGIEPPERINKSMDLPQFNRITGSLDFNFAEIKLTDAWCYAPDTTIQLSGLIYQKIPTSTTWLEIKVKLYLTGADKLKTDQYMPVTIRGEANDPAVEFLGMDLRKMK